MLNRGLALFNKYNSVTKEMSRSLCKCNDYLFVTNSLRLKQICGQTLCKSNNNNSKSSSPLLFSQRGYAKKAKPNLTKNPSAQSAKPNQTHLQAKITDGAPTEVPYKERTVAWPFPGPDRLPFRVTYNGINGYYAVRSSQWEIPGLGTMVAPFFNREDALFDMLQCLYFNSCVRGTKKPKYSIQMMGPGSGKTRMLTEWIMQAFANSTVIKRFLAGATNATERKTRRQFLNTLYRSSYKQHTIIAYGEQWIAASENALALEAALLDVIRRTILERHMDQSIEFEGRLITINSTTAPNFFGLHPQPTRLVRLFLALADMTYEEPPCLPFPQSGLLRNKSNIFFCIDECQVFSEHLHTDTTDALYLLFKEVAARHHDSMEGSGISPFWFAVGTNLPGRFFDLEGFLSQFDIITSSLGNLLEIKYLAQICKQFFGHKLPSYYIKDKSELPELPDIVAKAFVRNYLKTFGNPRAIERFVFAAMSQFGQITSSSQMRSPHCMRRIDQLDKALGADLLEIFRGMHAISGDKESINHLNIAAALCSELPYDTQIPGIEAKPKSLVTTGYLSVWRREQQTDPAKGLVKFHLTRPFFALSAEAMEKEILPSTATDNEHWKSYKVTLASLVLEKDCANYLTPNAKGEFFERAVASTLYARCALKGKGAVSLYDVFPAENMPDHLRDAIVKPNGVVILKHQVNEKSADVFDAIMQHQVIAIDVGNSEFVDVLLPITLPGNCNSILGFQCNTTKPPIKELVSTCKKVADHGLFYVAIAPVQHDNEKLISQLNPSQQSRAFLAKAIELVSPLYLVGMSFVPHDIAPTKLTKSSGTDTQASATTDETNSYQD